jgi:hypothetical protein
VYGRREEIFAGMVGTVKAVVSGQGSVASGQLLTSLLVIGFSEKYLVQFV